MLKKDSEGKLMVDFNSSIFERDVFMQCRKPILDDIAEKKERLRRLDQEIIDKVYSRTLLVKEIGEAARPLVNICRMLGTTADALFTEFYDKQFESEVVQKAVASVRRIFFDDTDPISQTFDCVDLAFSSYDHSLRFTFSNGDREFNVCFPCKLYEDKYQIDNETVGGEILVSCMRNENFEDTVVSSYDLDEIAAGIKSFMHGTFEPEKIERTSYERYSFLGEFNEALKIFHTYDTSDIFRFAND